MRLEKKLAVLLIFEQQSAAAGGGDYGNQPLDDRLEQRIELSLFAKPQRQLVEQGQGLRPIRIDRLPGLEDRGLGVDHFDDVEASVVCCDYGRIVRAPAPIDIGLGDGDLDLDRRIADTDRLAGLEADFTLSLDRLPVYLRAVGAAEILDPVVPVRDGDSRVRSRNAQVRGQIDVEVDTVLGSAKDDR